MSTTIPDTALSVARSLILLHEGKRKHVYLDTQQIPTVGVGLALMEPVDGQLHASPYAMKLCQRCGVDFGAVLEGDADLTDEQCDQLLNLCIIDCVEDLETLFQKWSDFTPNRQAALIDQRFNLGPCRFRGFKGEISAINLGNWITASLEMEDSRWAKQVPTRAKKLAEMVRQG